MEEIGKELILAIDLGGYVFKLDILMLLMSWLVIAIIIGGALVLRRGLNLQGDLEEVPSKRQALLEMLIEALREQLGGGFHSKQLANRLFPLLATMGVYLLMLNWLAIIPGMKSPTES